MLTHYPPLPGPPAWYAEVQRKWADAGADGEEGVKNTKAQLRLHAPALFGDMNNSASIASVTGLTTWASAEQAVYTADTLSRAGAAYLMLPPATPYLGPEYKAGDPYVDYTSNRVNTHTRPGERDAQWQRELLVWPHSRDDALLHAVCRKTAHVVAHLPHVKESGTVAEEDINGFFRLFLPQRFRRLVEWLLRHGLGTLGIAIAQALRPVTPIGLEYAGKVVAYAGSVVKEAATDAWTWLDTAVGTPLALVAVAGTTIFVAGGTGWALWKYGARIAKYTKGPLGVAIGASLAFGIMWYLGRDFLGTWVYALQSLAPVLAYLLPRDGTFRALASWLRQGRQRIVALAAGGPFVGMKTDQKTLAGEGGKDAAFTGRFTGKFMGGLAGIVGLLGRLVSWLTDQRDAATAAVLSPTTSVWSQCLNACRRMVASCGGSAVLDLFTGAVPASAIEVAQRRVLYAVDDKGDDETLLKPFGVNMGKDALATSPPEVVALFRASLAHPAIALRQLDYFAVTQLAPVLHPVQLTGWYRTRASLVTAGGYFARRDMAANAARAFRFVMERELILSSRGPQTILYEKEAAKAVAKRVAFAPPRCGIRRLYHEDLSDKPELVWSTPLLRAAARVRAHYFPETKLPTAGDYPDKLPADATKELAPNVLDAEHRARRCDALVLLLETLQQCLLVDTPKANDRYFLLTPTLLAAACRAKPGAYELLYDSGVTHLCVRLADRYETREGWRARAAQRWWTPDHFAVRDARLDSADEPCYLVVGALRFHWHSGQAPGTPDQWMVRPGSTPGEVDRAWDARTTMPRGPAPRGRREWRREEQTALAGIIGHFLRDLCDQFTWRLVVRQQPVPPLEKAPPVVYNATAAPDLDLVQLMHDDDAKALLPEKIRAKETAPSIAVYDPVDYKSYRADANTFASAH